MGRPTDLTDAVQQRIVQAIIGGNHFETACRYAGVAPNTGYEWMARGEGRDRNRERSETYANFAKAIRTAEAQMEVAVVTQIRSQVSDQPRLGLDFLARRFPDRWANREKVDIGGSGKEIVFRVVYGDSGEGRADGPAPQAAPEAGPIPGK